MERPESSNPQMRGRVLLQGEAERQLRWFKERGIETEILVS